MTRRAVGILVLAFISAGMVRAAEPAAPKAGIVGVQHWFGMATENIPAPIARQLKLKAGQGLMVVQVYPKSPAEEAGVQKDDLLTEVDGKPLLTQEDLVRAANLLDDKTGAIKPTKIKYLRDGDSFELTLSGAPRPADLAVVNADPPFVAGGAGNGAAGGGVRTIITPNGQQAKVGGGILITLNSDESQRLKIAEVAKGKENIILTVSTDDAGKQHHSISVGDKTYVVEKEKLGDLPADIRPLAEQLLKNGPQQTAKQVGVAPNLEQTVADQQREIDRLKQQMLELKKAQGEKK